MLRSFSSSSSSHIICSFDSHACEIFIINILTTQLHLQPTNQLPPTLQSKCVGNILTEWLNIDFSSQNPNYSINVPKRNNLLTRSLTHPLVHLLNRIESGLKFLRTLIEPGITRTAGWLPLQIEGHNGMDYHSAILGIILRHGVTMRQDTQQREYSKGTGL